MSARLRRNSKSSSKDGTMQQKSMRKFLCKSSSITSTSGGSMGGSSGGAGVRRSRFRLEINKLEKLYGREKEVQILEEVYHSVKGRGASAQVLMVGGKSGVGKTRVVGHLEDFILEETQNCRGDPRASHGYFVSGKFDQQRNSKPFSALADALTSLVEIIIQSEDSNVLAYRERASEALRKEWKTLAEVIPNLAHLLGSQICTDPAIAGDKECQCTDASSSSSKASTEAQEQESQQGNKLIRLKILFGVLMKSLSSPDHPIVLFLDDLQFSDEASVDLIESLFQDKQLQNILFLSGYRDDEITDRMKKMVENPTFTYLEVKDLSLEAISELLADAMELSQEDVLSLTNVILRKTQGNIFFVSEFLQSAQDKDLLYFSMETAKWTWNTVKIDTEMNVSNNVVDLVLGRLQTFPSEVQVLLSLASCLGAHFDTTLLATLYSQKTEPPPRLSDLRIPAPLVLATESREDDIRAMLQQVVDQGILITGDRRQYTFAHDRIQHASYLLLLEGKEKQAMELRVGLQLLRLFHSSISQRWMLFVAVNSITRNADLLDQAEKTELAKFNLEAAKKAKNESAFLLAADYLRNGLRLLNGEQTWTKCHKLTLEIYTMSAEMEYTGGNCRRAEELAREIIDRTDVPEDSKIPVYYTLMRAAGDQLKLKMALKIGIEALKRLGVTVPQKPILPRLLIDLHKTEKLLKGLTDNELLSLPKMTDAKKIFAMDFLMAITAYSWVLAESVLLSVIFLKSMRMSLRYGASRNLPSAFASYGILMSSLDKVEESFRFGQLAERLLAEDKEDAAGCYAFTLTIVHGNCSHWKQPLPHSTEPLLEGYRFGMMRSGDIEWACLCTATYTGIYICSGLPLGPFTSDARRFIQVALDYDQNISVIYVVFGLQVALNLMGESENPKVLSGEAMDEEETLQRLQKMDQNATIWVFFYYQIYVNYLMGDFEKAFTRGKALWALRIPLWKGHYLWSEALLFSALAEFARSRKLGAKKAPAEALKNLKVIKGYEKLGALNQHPKRLLLEAEAATFTNSRGKDHIYDVRRLFDGAISAAVRSGLTNYAAIANERAAEFMMDQSDDYWAKTYMIAARDYYVQWGAEVKAKALEKEHDALLSGSTREIRLSNGIRGQERYSVLRSPGVAEIQREEIGKAPYRSSERLEESEQTD